MRNRSQKQATGPRIASAASLPQDFNQDAVTLEQESTVAQQGTQGELTCPEASPKALGPKVVTKRDGDGPRSAITASRGGEKRGLDLPVPNQPERRRDESLTRREGPGQARVPLQRSASRQGILKPGTPGSSAVPGPDATVGPPPARGFFARGRCNSRGPPLTGAPTGRDWVDELNRRQSEMQSELSKCWRPSPVKSVSEM